MKKVLLLCAALLLSKFGFGQTPITLQGDITSDMTLSSKNFYLVHGFVYVKNNATLTIEPGTVIMGEKSTHGTLIITRSGKIMANGTKGHPVVFTSDQPAGQRQSGDWGGVVLLGKAPANGGENMVYEGDILNEASDPDASKFGGTDPHHSSGKISYTRIEFAGYPVKPDQEINGLTFGAIGDGTQIDHVQVSFSNDDSYEWFGGTVNCKYMVAYAGVDDDWDTDNGYSGSVQFGFSLRNNKVWDPGSGSNGFESDNDAAGSTSTPITKAVFSNMTIIGPTNIQTGSKWLQMAQIRRNSSLSIINSVMLGWTKGILLDGGATYENQVKTGNIKLENNIVVPLSSGKVIDTTGAGGKPFDASHNFDAKAWFDNQGNKSYSSFSDVKLGDLSDVYHPNPVPQNGSPALGMASFSSFSSNSFLDKSISYVGAFNTGDNWMESWTNFNPNGTEYHTYDPSGIETIETGFSDVNLYPNPTMGNATLEFFVAKPGKISVKVYDITGKVVSTVADNNMGFGLNRLNIETNSLPKGVYFVNITSDNGSKTVRLSVM